MEEEVESGFGDMEVEEEEGRVWEGEKTAEEGELGGGGLVRDFGMRKEESRVDFEGGE